ncbi:MFS transporter [Paeniglutamicibacter sp.]|uniref:MFS transporter n=1 Tax=Paeniglutamicibacter sp. TaxID=1934391 RepID=UPI003988DCCB
MNRPAKPKSAPTLTAPAGVAGPARWALAPLYAAGFTTAFGAHSIAAGLGAESGGIGLGLLTFGILLALYDVAEVILKPIFGSLSDRIGAKPVIVAGLAAFTLASLVGTLGTTPLILGLARLGQGAAASAFSPASSAAVARLAGPAVGSYFGKYGSWKSMGYVLGPLLGAALIWVGGFPALFLAMAIVAAAAAVWTWIAMPDLPVLPRPRYTVADLVRQSTERSFLVPTLALAAATSALGVAVGFLPLLGTELRMPVGASMAVVAILALSSSLTQPLAGRLRDRGQISSRSGIGWGLALVVVGVATLALVPTPFTLYVSAVVIGCGIGITTPLGFAHLAATTPPERIGRTMGSAELGREAGDAGGPLIVGVIASSVSLAAGLGTLAFLIAAIAVVCVAFLGHGTRPRT